MTTFVGTKEAGCTIDYDTITKKAGQACEVGETTTVMDEASVALTSSNFSMKINMSTFFKTEDT